MHTAHVCDQAVLTYEFWLGLFFLFCVFSSLGPVYVMVNFLVYFVSLSIFSWTSLFVITSTLPGKTHFRNVKWVDCDVNPLVCRGNYIATSNDMKLVHWPLMGGLLHLVQQGGGLAGCGSAQSPPCCTKCNSPPVKGQCTNHRVRIGV